jgi:hypothetical protein
MRCLIIFGISFLYIILTGMSVSLVAENDINDCADITVEQVISVLLGQVTIDSIPNKCRNETEFCFSIDNEFKSRFILREGKKPDYESFPFRTDQWRFLNYFRKFELILLSKLGAPEFTYKQGDETDLSLDIYNIAKGRVEYLTVWNLRNEHLLLVIKGKDYRIKLYCYWK